MAEEDVIAEAEIIDLEEEIAHGPQDIQPENPRQPSEDDLMRERLLNCSKVLESD